MSDLSQLIPIAKITDPGLAMRSGLDDGPIEGLVASIREKGLINPITVRQRGELYEVVAGHRRFRACQLLNRPEIPCVVRELDDAGSFSIMAAENLERLDVDPVDEALFVGRLLQLPGNDIESVAKLVRRSPAWVEDRLEILDYPDYMLAPLREGQLKLGVAKYLGRIEDDVYRKMYVEQAVKFGTSVLQAEYILNQYKLGVFVPSDTILPTNAELGYGQAPRIVLPCAKCGKDAEAPNLRSVWIHNECPVGADVEEPQKRT